MFTPQPKHTNPYKTKLWLIALDHDTFSKKELELWCHIADWKGKGCGDYNCQLMTAVHRCRRSVQYYLRNLEAHALIEIEHPYGHRRRIHAICWPKKQAWQAASNALHLSQMGAKKCTPLKRKKRHLIGNAGHTVSERPPGTGTQEVSPASPSTQNFPQAPDGLTTFGSGGLPKEFELVRLRIIEQLMRTGWKRDRAIALGNIKFAEYLERRKKDPERHHNGI